MSLFRHQVFFQIGTGRPWTNVYHTDTADLATAALNAVTTLAPGVLHAEDPTVTLVKIITSTPGVPGAFIDSAVAAAGTASGLGDLLPLFNTARILFPILVGGRSDSKFIRGFIDETHSAGGLIAGSSISGLETIFTNLITAMAAASSPLVDTDLNLYSIAVCQAAIQERQLHRRRRRTP
jgi:hypothetical protein